jgi:hypothetical protein
MVAKSNGFSLSQKLGTSFEVGEKDFRKYNFIKKIKLGQANINLNLSKLINL